jgi:PncC family amidohydrolase
VKVFEKKSGIECRAGLLLSRGGKTLAVAESCTGGLLGHRITSASGSSTYFRGGIIAYANEVKVRELDVDPALLDAKGAVSEPVARQMAEGVRKRFRTDFGIGITGIAGPQGGTEGKPVGLVYVAVATNTGQRVKRFRFEGDRGTVKKAGTDAALAMLMEDLQSESEGEDHGEAN